MNQHGKHGAWGWAVLAAALAACGGGGSKSESLPPAVDISGTWAGTLTSEGSGTSSFSLVAAQSGADVTGTFTGAGGGGTLTGTVSGRALDVTAHLTGGECTGTLDGTGEVSADGNQITFSYDGTLSCSGHAVPDRGSASLTRQTPSVGSGAQAFCDRLSACSGTPLSPAELESCRQMMAAPLAVIPDPASFGACMAGLDCGSLADEAALAVCVNLDPARTTCNGAILHACANGGPCVDDDCHGVCALAGLSYAGCGYDAGKGHDVCVCG